MTITPLDRFVAFATSRRLRGASTLCRALRGKVPVTLIHTRTIDGLTFAVDPESPIDECVIRRGYYEREVLDALLKVLPAKGVFWDVGANMGLHAVTLAKRRDDVTVIAFEPVPFTMWRLTENAKLNGATVFPVSTALSDRAGAARMSVALQGNSGVSSLSPWPGVTYESEIFVLAEAGDRLMLPFGELAVPNVIKLDVEGHELKALLGLRQWLASEHFVALVFESGPQQLDAVRRFLSEYDLRLDALPSRDSREHERPVNFIGYR